MSTTNKNTALEVPTTSTTVNESDHHSNTIQSTRHGRKLTFHTIINTDDVRNGVAQVFRTLCGKQLPVPRAIHKPSRSAVESVTNHSFCQACNDLYDLEQELGL